jgi:hypothetical protein
MCRGQSLLTGRHLEFLSLAWFTSQTPLYYNHLGKSITAIDILVLQPLNRANVPAMLWTIGAVWICGAFLDSSEERAYNHPFVIAAIARIVVPDYG